MRTMSVGRAKYFFTFVDDFSRKVWVYMMRCKGEWFENFKGFQAFVETQLEHKTSIPMDERRGLHFEGLWSIFFYGIRHRKHPSTHWTGGVCNSRCCHNGKAYAQSSKAQKIALGRSGGKRGLTLTRCPTKALRFDTLEEMWSGQRPCVAHIHVFGSLVYTWFQMRYGASSMQKELGACFSEIVNVYKEV